jgi:hypothetical protein
MEEFPAVNDLHILQLEHYMRNSVPMVLAAPNTMSSSTSMNTSQLELLVCGSIDNTTTNILDRANGHS